MANLSVLAVSVISTATNTVVATIPVGIEPQAFGNVIGGAFALGPPLAARIGRDGRVA